jgi:predicted peptidase
MFRLPACALLGLIVFASHGLGQDTTYPGIVCDNDSDCFYVPASADTSRAPALLVLSCTGAVPHDLDSVRSVADSYGLVLASCHGSRNHRASSDDDRDIINTFQKLVMQYRVDATRVFICGFSGMGAQSIYEVVTHPALFRGALSACSPGLDLSGLDPQAMSSNLFYLISRDKDWNLKGNQQMYAELQSLGITSTLQILPGEHSPGPLGELFQGMDWLLSRTN